MAYVINDACVICGTCEGECPVGAISAGDGKYEITYYTSCCNTQKGIYYYTTYENHQISAVNMYHENLNCSRLIRYSPIKKEQIRFQN